MLGAAIWAALAVEEPVKAPVRAVYGWRDGLVADHKAHLLPLQSADGAEFTLRDQVERRGFLLLMEALAVEKIHESADARLALDTADDDVDGRRRVLCLHVGNDGLCAVGCVDWVAGHAEEKRDDLVLTLERPQLRGEPPQAGGEMDGVGGAKHCKPSVPLSVSISNLESRCPRFRWSRKRCFSNDAR